MIRPMQVLCRLNTAWLVGLLDDPPMRCWVLAKRVIEDGRGERWAGSAYLSNSAALRQSVREKVTHAGDHYEGFKSMAISRQAKAWLAALPPRLEPTVPLIRARDLERPAAMPGAATRLPVVVPPWPSNWNGLAA